MSNQEEADVTTKIYVHKKRDGTIRVVPLGPKDDVLAHYGNHTDWSYMVWVSKNPSVMLISDVPRPKKISSACSKQVELYDLKIVTSALAYELLRRP